MTGPAPHELQVLARQLMLESEACRAVQGLAEHGIASVVVKGPVTARLLYDRLTEHPYGDVDLLVPPTAYEQARRHFLDQGFRDAADGVEQAYRADNEAHLVRGEVCIDLHSRLVGVPAGRSRQAWDSLTRDLDVLPLHGQELPVFGAPARALHLALHAAQSAEDSKALKDLVQGLSRLDGATWERARDLAAEIGALPAFATGLRRAPGGRQLAASLGLPTGSTADAWLRVHAAPEEALALERLRALPDAAARRRAVRDLLTVADRSGRPSWRRRTVVSARLLLAVPVWLRALAQERRR